ncbi:MAG: hypothetical protein KDD21_10660 [Bacteroidetes bacterium]|nr:hypothetical protein [Bacteroidota bacterium]
MELTTDEHIINKFREMIAKRYDYEDLIKRLDVPKNISEANVLEVKDYFLNTIYPPAVERKKLEEAFGELADYVRSPKKIWALFGDMARALFKFGRHFMQAMRAGMDSLNSFVGAKNFEASMAAIANKNSIVPPMSDEDFEDTLYQLPREEVEKFISDVKNLFGAMVNTKLLQKTLDILQHVIETMEKKPQTFPKKDVDGIKLGKELLQRGYDIFSKYDEATKTAMVELIYKNEMWYMEDVYRRKEDK